MISSFWNLCRACPSLPVEKLHSEYRSTFQWHEYLGSKTNAAGISHAVVRQPVQASKTQAFWSGGQPGGGGEERRGGKRVHIANVNNAVVNEWWLKSSKTDTTARPPNQAQVRGHSKLETQLPSEESGGPRKSMSMHSMGTIPQTHQVVTHHITSQNNNADIGVNRTEPRINMDSTRGAGGGGPDSLEWSEHRITRENMSSSYEVPKTLQSDEARVKRKEYKSEYKKQFRPFSQYEYVDGKFFKKRGDQEMGVNPWYKEVIELRQKAGEYRHRGWGSEFVPPHLADVYHQNVWDQVSKQPSLAALALIQATTKKSISKEEKEKENARKSLPKRSLSRPNTATPKHPLSESKMRDSEAVQGAKKKYDGPPSTASGRASRGKARSQSAGPGGRSPRKTMTHHSVMSKEREILVDPNKPAPRHPRPSSADPSLGFSEPVIKSPPEPTRVKSPEQVILRSPDPVNWTVPLDTTKSFTVTQNIRDAPPSPRFRAGDSSRSGPLSGVQSSSASTTKTSSPALSSFSPRSGGLAQKPKSAPPTKTTPTPPKPSGKSVLTGGEKKVPTEYKPMKSSSPFNLNGNNETAQGLRTVKSPPPKLDNQKPDDSTNNNRGISSTTSYPQSKQSTKPVEASVRKPIPGSTLKCLEDPQFMFDPPKGTPYIQSGGGSKSTPTPPIAGTHKVTSPPNPTSPPVPAPRGTSGGIRVLEAPSSTPPTGFVPPAPVAVSSTAKRLGSSQVSDSLPPKTSAASSAAATSSQAQSQPSKLPSYKVLDAPDPADMYKSTMIPSTAGITSPPPTTTSATSALTASTSSTTSSGSGSGGKSKHKFDFKFWGKSKDNEKS